MSNGIKKSNEDIKEKNEEIKKLTNQNDKQQTNGDKLENVPRTYQIVITLRDYYLPKREDEEEMPFTLDEGQCVEVLDNTNPTAWLVRTKVKFFFK